MKPRPRRRKIKPRCSLCIFWHKDETMHGKCHRYPMQAVCLTFPRTLADDWCGEFKPKRKTK